MHMRYPNLNVETANDMPPSPRSRGGNAAALGVADFLSLAAAPTFATMALLTPVLGGSADMICSAAHASPLSGMIPMYVLMSGFHLAPWLKLIASRRSPGGALLRSLQ